MLNKDNKTIYKNTIIIYVRMIIVTLIGLFSSRFVLQALGASDYGLYNVVDVNEEVICDLVACSNDFINRMVEKYKEEMGDIK